MLMTTKVWLKKLHFWDLSASLVDSFLMDVT